jgi:hypothetical protein
MLPDELLARVAVPVRWPSGRRSSRVGLRV